MLSTTRKTDGTLDEKEGDAQIEQLSNSKANEGSVKSGVQLWCKPKEQNNSHNGAKHFQGHLDVLGCSLWWQGSNVHNRARLHLLIVQRDKRKARSTTTTTTATNKQTNKQATNSKKKPKTPHPCSRFSQHIHPPPPLLPRTTLASKTNHAGTLWFHFHREAVSGCGAQWLYCCGRADGRERVAEVEMWRKISPVFAKARQKKQKKIVKLAWRFVLFAQR